MCLYHGFVYRQESVSLQWICVGGLSGFMYSRSAFESLRDLLRRGFRPGFYRIVVHCVSDRGTDVVVVDRKVSVSSKEVSNV